jgi:hypothetical protein
MRAFAGATATSGTFGKSQISGTKSQEISKQLKSQMDRSTRGLGLLRLAFEIYLGFVIWDLPQP